MHFFACSAVIFSSLSGNAVQSSGAGDDPFADAVISFDAGIDPAPGYETPASTLGSPERFTGEGIVPSVVSAFSGPWGFDELYSIGAGGHLVVRFNTPVANDPNNLYGIDLLIFGNTAFLDASYPNGIVGGFFGGDGGIVEVSVDGQSWHTVPGAAADGPMPTIGYQDSGPYDATPGTVLTDFTRPVDPALDLSHFMNLGNAQVVERYRGSGGGAGVDLSSVGLQQISYVRISNSAGSIQNIEIDALSDVAPRLPGDVDLDGVVNINDLLLVIAGWGAPAPGGPPADFDLSGTIDINDLLIVISNWSM